MEGKTSTSPSLFCKDSNWQPSDLKSISVTPWLQWLLIKVISFISRKNPCSSHWNQITVSMTHGSNSVFCILPVPSCSRWWQRWTSNWASCSDTPKEGTNQGAKQESTRAQAARAVGDTSWSQGSWEPQSLSKLEEEEIKQTTKYLQIKRDIRVVGPTNFMSHFVFFLIYSHKCGITAQKCYSLIKIVQFLLVSTFVSCQMCHNLCDFLRGQLKLNKLQLFRKKRGMKRDNTVQRVSSPSGAMCLGRLLPLQFPGEPLHGH